MNYVSLFSVQDLQIDEEVDVIVSEWMGYMLLYEVTSVVYGMGCTERTRGKMILDVTNCSAEICGATISVSDLMENKLALQNSPVHELFWDSIVQKVSDFDKECLFWLFV